MSTTPPHFPFAVFGRVLFYVLLLLLLYTVGLYGGVIIVDKALIHVCLLLLYNIVRATGTGI